ncbi:MAG: VOC family protein [Acidimicrobiia bacterium]|nr:VOC family protein [Acidimicrobiia bacterium]MDH3462611.1 VOC family protein [Acidimicrobiia bacterium]
MVMIPVTDVDRSRTLYEEKVGFHLDVDHQPNDSFRVVQMTPPGSACSIVFGIGMTTAEPGSEQGTLLVVTDIEAAHQELTDRGLEVGPIHHFVEGREVDGPDPERNDYNSFARFVDPDGNTWGLQEVRSRISG